MAIRKRKVVRLIRNLAIGAAVVTVAIGGCAASSLILGSNHDQVNPQGAIRHMIQVDGRDVECWIARSPGAEKSQPRAFAIFFTGKSDRADRWTQTVANAWKDKAIEVWGMNYPGAGGSTGPPRLASLTPDALAVYDVVKQSAGSRPIFVQAASFGAAVALDLARRRPVAGLILQNPPPLRELLLGHYGWWNLWLLAGPAAVQLPHEIDAIANARELHVPAVFIECTEDRIVPPGYQQRVYDAYVGPKRRIFVQGGGHSSPLTDEASNLLDLERDWLWDGPFASIDR